jgi:hypothetical protein
VLGNLLEVTFHVQDMRLSGGQEREERQEEIENEDAHNPQVFRFSILFFSLEILI